MNLRQAIAEAAAHLSTRTHLQPTAQRDAELLLLHTLAISRASLIAHSGDPLTHDQAARYQTAIARRLKDEPIQYITGQQEFYGLNLRVTPAVLIPRPETEHLVEAVLAKMAKMMSPHHQPLRIADIGTGSGAIAIALATHLPQASITAIDISLEALQIAEANAHLHHVAHRIRFQHADLLAAHETHAEPFDAIVSNPPYIPLSDHDQLHPQVRSHEPHAALFAGPTGLDLYRRLIPQAEAALKTQGLLALEIGHGQREALTALLANWHNVTFLDDLQQIPRVVLASKR